MDAYQHGGSAGGVAAGLAAFFNAKLVSGISYFLDVVQFERDLKNADLVITAEGKVDNQTLEGKGPFGVAQKALQHAIPVVILAGAVPVSFNKELHQFFDAIFPISNEPARLDEAISNTASNLERTAFEIGNLLALNIFKRKNK
jgi:glycerate kinase